MRATDASHGTWTVAQFATPGALLSAVRELRADETVRLDTFSPFPLHGGSEALGLRRSTIPGIALAGAVLGGMIAYGVIYYMNAVELPLNVGNRPPHAPPMMVPVTFEVTVLFSALCIFFGLMALAGLPRPYHPVFDWEAFGSASTHGFWIGVLHAKEPAAAEALESQLRALGGDNIGTVMGRGAPRPSVVPNGSTQPI